MKSNRVSLIKRIICDVTIGSIFVAVIFNCRHFGLIFRLSGNNLRTKSVDTNSKEKRLILFRTTAIDNPKCSRFLNRSEGFILFFK